MDHTQTAAVELPARDFFVLKNAYREYIGNRYEAVDRQDARILQAIEAALAKLEGREPVGLYEMFEAA